MFESVFFDVPRYLSRINQSVAYGVQLFEGVESAVIELDLNCLKFFDIIQIFSFFPKKSFKLSVIFYTNISLSICTKYHFTANM